MSKNRRFYRFRWLTGGFVFVLLLTGNAYGEIRPIVHYEASKLIGYQDGNALVRVALRVKNPNPESIPVSFGRLDLRLDHKHVGIGVLHPVSLPAKGSVTVQVPVSLSLLALGEVAPDLVMENMVPWSGSGMVEVNNKKVPLVENGEISSKVVQKFLGKLL